MAKSTRQFEDVGLGNLMATQGSSEPFFDPSNVKGEKTND